MKAKDKKQYLSCLSEMIFDIQICRRMTGEVLKRSIDLYHELNSKEDDFDDELSNDSLFDTSYKSKENIWREPDFN